MQVLVTGAFGNIGSSAVSALLEAGHRVRALVHPSPASRLAALRLQGRVEVCWADVRDAAAVAAAMRDQEVVIHLAAILPPESEDHPGLARATNVDGTVNLLQAAARQPAPLRFLFASSFDVFGPTQHLPPPRCLTDPVVPTDHYSRHKIECEQLVKESWLPWAIFRFADVPPLGMRGPHPIMYRIPLDTRFEVLHPRDAGLALANAMKESAVWGRTLLIGGGRGCQIRYCDYLRGMLDVMGVGMLPEEAFGTQPYCTDWLDTEESEQLLRYQRHSWQDVLRDVALAFGPRRHLARPLRRGIRWWLLSMSPYLKAARAAGRPSGTAAK